MSQIAIPPSEETTMTQDEKISVAIPLSEDTMTQDEKISVTIPLSEEVTTPLIRNEIPVIRNEDPNNGFPNSKAFLETQHKQDLAT